MRDKKRAEVTVKAAARKTRAQVAKDEGESAAAEVRLPPWRELVAAGPAEGMQSAGEAEEASALPAELEQVPAEAMEDQSTAVQPDAAAAESPEPSPLELEAPLDEPEVASAPVDEAVEPELAPGPVPELEPKQGPEPAPDLAQEAEDAAPERAAPSPVEDAPVLRRSHQSALRPVERLAQARLLARVSRGEALPSGLETLLPGVPAQLLRDVSIHTDTAAARAAERLHAEAFTIGTHVYFAEGRFALQSSDGLALLAHELAHVAQYRTGRLAGLPAVSQPSDPVEHEADGWAVRWRAPAAVEADGAAGAEPARANVAIQPDPSAAEAPEPINDGRTLPRSAVPSDGPVLRRATDTARTFFDKSYFAQADEWSSVSGDIDGSLAADTQATTAAFPTPQAELGPASQAPTPASAAPTTLSLGEQVPEPGADTGQVQPEATETPAAPATPATPRIAFGADGDSSAAQRNFSAALGQVPTSLDSLETSPLPPPVELTGSADPAQAAEQAQTAAQQAETLRGQAAANVDNGPGPEQVQPRSIRDARLIEEAQAPASEPLPEIGRMTEIEAAGTVTAEIQAETDAQGQAQIDATLAEAKTQLDDAAIEADEKQAQEVQGAEQENARLNAEANAEQEFAVSEARTNIEDNKEDTKRQQHERVDEAEVKNERERQKLADDVDARVEQDEQRIDDAFSDAERDAERVKGEGEAEAERKKREAERDAENDSWWDRVADAISSAFAALTSFIGDVFDAAISAVGAIIDAVKEAAAAIINAVRDFVVSALQALGDVLTGLIDDLLGDIFPVLAAALTQLVNAAVDRAVSAVNALADALIAGINALLDAIGGAITAILEAYQAAINAALAFAQALLTGDWAALGRMILEAVLTLAGIPPEAFYALIARAMGALDTIIDDPGAFVGNVINAVGQGFRSFADNILTHLQEGFFRWIVGPLGELGVTLPTSWDIVGILGLVLQVLGLTASGIRSIIVEVLGEAAGAIFDFVWRYVDALITGGWEGLWEQIQNDLSQLWSTVVDGIKDYLIETIVTQAVLRIATMFNPVGALLNAVMMVWNVYNFLRTNIQRIWGVVTSIVNMIATIVAGNITPAAQAVENAIASLIPIAISLLANLLGLGGLTTKVREVLESVRAAVRNAIVSLIRRVQGLFSGGGTRDDDAATDPSGGDQEIGQDAPASGGGESHTVTIDQVGSDARLMINTTPTPAEHWVNDLPSRAPWSSMANNEDFRTKKQNALALAAQIDTEADALARLVVQHASDESPPPVEDDSVESKQRQFAQAVSQLLALGRIEDPVAFFSDQLGEMPPGAHLYATEQLGGLPDNLRVPEWDLVGDWLGQRTGFDRFLGENSRVGNDTKLINDAAVQARLTQLANGPVPNEDVIGVVGRAKPKIHQGNAPYGALNTAFKAFTFSASTASAARSAADGAYADRDNGDIAYVTNTLRPQDQALVDQYDALIVPMQRSGEIAGNAIGLRNQFEGQLRSSSGLKYMFAAGFGTQMRQIIQAATLPTRLRGVEVSVGDRRADYTEWTEGDLVTVVEVKNWTGRARWTREQRLDRVLEAVAQVQDHLTSPATDDGDPIGGVRLEVRGGAPALLQSRAAGLSAFAAAQPTKIPGRSKRFDLSVIS
ncbi:MAG: DUF4157 domain-containing protein [bacterium]|nr:DUF4157 domain-containing protein [bacterium]